MIEYIKDIIGKFYFPCISFMDIIEIIIFSVILYYLLKNVKGTRMWVVFKGIGLLAIVYVLAYLFSFNAILVIFQNITLILTIAVVTVFQPEIRKFLETLGSNGYGATLPTLSKKIKKPFSTIMYKLNPKTIEDLTNTAKALSKTKTGALIVIENKIPLNDFISTGISLDSAISSQLLINIFEKNTPLHDGAVIIKDGKISAATCYLPLSENPKINKKLGTRHRAAIGITETTDALVIIVSEETGHISIAKSGNIKSRLSEQTLKEELLKFNEENIVTKEKLSFKEMLLNNYILKIISVILGFVIWVTLINVYNPIVSKRFDDIPVIIQNENAIADIGKTYTINSDELIDVIIKDNRNNIESIKPEHIKIYADFERLSDVSSINLTAEVENLPNTKITLLKDNIKVSLEDLIETEYDVEINKTGKLNDGIFIGDVILENKSVSIKGPASIMKIVDKVVIDVNITDVISNTSFVATPKIYDKNGDLITNSKIIINNEQISGSIKTLQTKSVPFKVTLVPQDAFTKSLIAEYVPEMKDVLIAGNESSLANINEIHISVPITIDVSQANAEKFSKNIKIADYFNITDVFLTNENISTNINVMFNTQNITREIKVSTSKIRKNNLNPNYSASFNNEYITVVISGQRQKVLDINENNIVPYVNLKNMYGGTKTVDVYFNDVDGVKFDKLTTTIILQWKN